MKQPSSHMRRGSLTGNSESSGIGHGTRSSDSIEPLPRSDGPGLNLVSDRYRRRRASGQSVKFTLPDTNHIALKLKGRRNFIDGLVADEDEEDERDFGHYALDYRRMSAPELPPINSSGKNSVLLNDGFLASRSNTFHSYKLASETRPYRKSIHSDSSLTGYRLTSHSRTSSSSSKNSRSRVQSAGTEGRKQQREPVREISKETPSPAVKFVPPTMKNGISGIASRCDSQNGYRRAKTKTSLINNNNNNNNNNVTTPRKMKHVHSESYLNSRESEVMSVKQTEQQELRRNASETFTETKKNLRNSQNAINGRRKTATSSNLNGMRRFSSTLGLSSEERKSDEGIVNGKDDCDSDCDSDKDQRVMDWILGVSEVAEPPEEPDIEYMDEPPQRDTAIRIVYDGDS